jgi:hypothetical protein
MKGRVTVKKRCVAVLIGCSLALTGCTGLYNGSYSTVRPHVQTEIPVVKQSLSAENEQELLGILQELIEDGKSDAVIYVDGYNQQLLQGDMQRICDGIKRSDPVAAYALDGVTFELGKSDGRPVLSLVMKYTKSRAEILGIRSVQDMDKAAEQIRKAMVRCDVSLVMNISAYEERDLLQIVENYAMENPQKIMETPQVSWNVYRGTGKNHVLELFFTYQTSRDSLKAMQENVEPVFASAALYVSGDASAEEKFSQLYSFLMERYDYQFDTSITPTYSLLRHGVGDSRAFAVVYAAMCRQAELDCAVVSGTKNGESHYWNIIGRDDRYFHVDLLVGSYQELTDEQMTGYVWDYSAYPVCTDTPIPREPLRAE